jgi:hypothetical protein
MSHQLELGQRPLILEFLRSDLLLPCLLPLIHQLEQLHTHKLPSKLVPKMQGAQTP